MLPNAIGEKVAPITDCHGNQKQAIKYFWYHYMKNAVTSKRYIEMHIISNHLLNIWDYTTFPTTKSTSLDWAPSVQAFQRKLDKTSKTSEEMARKG